MDPVEKSKSYIYILLFIKSKTLYYKFVWEIITPVVVTGNDKVLESIIIIPLDDVR